MERKSSKENSVVSVVEGEKFKLRTCLRGLHLVEVVGSAAISVGTTLEFTAFDSGPEVKPSRAGAFWFFLSTTMVFAAVRTHFPKKNTCVYRNTVTCVTRVTSNGVEVDRLNSQHLAMLRTSNMAELVPSGIFCLQPWVLQRSEHFSVRKTPVFMSIQLRSTL